MIGVVPVVAGLPRAALPRRRSASSLGSTSVCAGDLSFQNTNVSTKESDSATRPLSRSTISRILGSTFRASARFNKAASPFVKCPGTFCFADERPPRLPNYAAVLLERHRAVKLRWGVPHLGVADADRNPAAETRGPWSPPRIHRARGSGHQRGPHAVSALLAKTRIKYLLSCTALSKRSYIQHRV